VSKIPNYQIVLHRYENAVLLTQLFVFFSLVKYGQTNPFHLGGEIIPKFTSLSSPLLPFVPQGLLGCLAFILTA
jgi:hypothetical protein